MDSDPLVDTFLGNTPIGNVKETEDIIQNIKKQYKENGTGRLAIIDKKTNTFIGWSGIKYEKGFRPFLYYDLGYRLIRKFWGQGIATEAAKASLKYGFETLKLDEICAATEVNHVASNKILQNMGLKLIDVFEYDRIMHNLILPHK